MGYLYWFLKAMNFKIEIFKDKVVNSCLIFTK